MIERIDVLPEPDLPISNTFFFMMATKSGVPNHGFVAKTANRSDRGGLLVRGRGGALRWAHALCAGLFELPGYQREGGRGRRRNRNENAGTPHHFSTVARLFRTG